ncbi:hypothetical protein [Gordonia sp. (in: high G+C Gram-positive bacteria)]|uniref:hypothetical protein n=1 Tax=Gordonia sp. (in: high G+C Gram-positive bacteria) TaxID=84139 RepID=UPI0016BA3D21|nr:hypothetical protein [Gordonia sp. (in: high G+C Gram-positive bacteria)]NLG47242.1 hypothetical protein [Gordonia sp. (in: high G+C Gram-positive bacteria)]
MKHFRRLLETALIILCAGTVLVACGSDEEPDDGTVKLPADFPSQIQVVDGAILTSSGESPRWQVTIQARAGDGNALTNAVAKLTDEGFTESSRVDEPASKSVLLSKDVDGKQLWVNVGLSADAAAGASTVIYQVSVAG